MASKIPISSVRQERVMALSSIGNNLKGPGRLLASCAKILLVASTLLAIEAVVMIFFSGLPDTIIKPLILLGYLEICAMFFSGIGIICGIVGLIFYHPYLYLSDKTALLLARRAPHGGYRYTYSENVPSPLRTNNSEEDGVPD